MYEQEAQDDGDLCGSCAMRTMRGLGVWPNLRGGF